MKTKKMNTALLMGVLGGALLLVNVVSDTIWRYQPLGLSDSTAYFFTTLVAIIVHVALLSYGYTLLRKMIPNDKAQWHLVLTSTIALTLSTVVAEVIGFFILHIGPDIEYRANPIIILLSLVMNFLLSLGAVYTIMQFHKRRFGFEVE